MTDLVSQLVGALEFYADPLRYSGPNQRSVPGDKHTPDGAPYMVDVTRDGGQIAQAALTAAKVGGWLPIETAPRGSGIDGPDSVSHPDYVHPPKLLLWTEEGPLVGYYDWYYHPGYGRGAEDGESVWRDHSGARTYGATAWQPLPTPPKEQS